MKIKRNSVFMFFIIACCISVVYFLFTSNYFAKQLEYMVYDRYLQAKVKDIDNDVVIVSVDDESLKELGIWPWTRNYHAALVDKLTTAKVNSIVLNILFTEKSNADDLLFKAIEKNSRVILPVAPPINPASIYYADKNKSPFNFIAAQLGHNAIMPDQDGIIRRVSLWGRIQGKDYPSLALASLIITDPQKALKYSSQTFYGNKKVNSFLSSPILFAYTGKPKSIRQFSYIDVLAGHVPNSQLENKIVFVGTSAAGLGASYNVPAFFKDYQQMSGVELQAQIYEALHHDLIISELSWIIAALINIFLISLTCFLIININPINGIFISIISCVLQILMMLIAITTASFWVPLTSSICILIIFTVLYITFSSHIKLLEINRTLESKVIARTQDLVISNVNLEQQIAERKRIASSLQDKEKQLRILLDSLHVAVVMLDNEGVIFKANKTIKSLFGIDPQKIIGTSLSHYFAQDDDNKLVSNATPIDIMEVFKEFSQEHETIYHTNSVRKADGTIFPVDLAFTLMTQDQKTYLICSIRDISEQVKSEILTQEFIATVSHELRTPITSIRGSLALIYNGQAGDLSSKIQNLINIALRNSERLLALVNDILDIQKIQLGQLDFNLSKINLIDIIKQSLEVNDSYAKSYHTSFVFKKTEYEDIFVLVDANRFVQVMSNLLSNAAKFSPSGSVVDIQVEKIASNVKISVIDYGTGIPEEFKSKIFQKFAQADDSKHRSRGTGLGLSITKTLIEKMGGEISFISEAGKGSTFFIILPIASESLIVS